MVFYLEFTNSSIGRLSQAQIDSFSFACSIFKLYSIAQVVIKDFTKEINNMIKSGMPVDVVFTDNDNKTYVSKMSVLSFKKVPSPQTSFVDYTEVTLVPAMYFDGKMSSSAHKGTVHDILEEILSKQFQDSVTNKDIVQTEDLIRRRYQLGERPQEFMERITKYGVKGKMPVYMYFDSKGTLNLGSIADMVSSQPKYIANSVLADQLYQIPGDGETLNKLNFYNFQMSNLGKGACSQIDSIFTVEGFRTTTDIVDSLTYTSPEYNNSQAQKTSPPKTKYFDWNLAPNDAFAIAAREAFEETAYTYSLSASFSGFAIDELPLGSVLYVILPYEPTALGNNDSKINLGEGLYMVTQLKFTFESNVMSTSATMIQVAS